MRRKRLQEFANNLCAMLVGWRMQEDLEVLADLGNVDLTVDLLTGKAHTSKGALELYIAGEMKAWLEHQFKVCDIDASKVSKALVEAKIVSDRVATDRKRGILFEFEVRSTLSTDEKTYSGYLKEAHQWHTRVSTGGK